MDDAGPVADDGANTGTPTSPFAESDAGTQQAQQAQAAFDTLRHQRAFISAIRSGNNRAAQAYNTMGR